MQFVRRAGQLQPRFITLASVCLSFRREMGSELGEIFPPPMSFARFPEVKEIIDVPAEVEVTLSSFDVLRPIIRNLVTRWRVEGRANLAAAVRDVLDLPDDVDPLDLAVGCFYRCTRCHYAQSIEGILTHHCDLDRAKRWPLPVYSNTASYTLKRPEYTEVYSIGRTIRKLLEVCGKDWKICTAEEMDTSEVRFYCTTLPDITSPGATIRECMNWRAAVSYFLFMIISTNIHQLRCRF